MMKKKEKNQKNLEDIDLTIVPKEPTLHMIAAATKIEGITPYAARVIYLAMLAAADTDQSFDD